MAKDKKSDSNGNMEYGLRTLLEFISSHNGFDENKRFYESLGMLLEDKFKTKSLLIFSVSGEACGMEDKDVFEKCRSLWNRQKIGKGYDREIIKSLLLKVCENDDLHGSWNEYKENDRLFYSFHCGGSKEQFFFGLFESENEILPDVLSYIVRLSITISESVQKWQELKKIESLVHIDDVTGLYNQRKLLKDLDAAIRKHREYKESFAVLFIDIDHFKQVNDGHGHLVGTQLLSDIGSLIKGLLRDYDLCYRYGGDEFVIIIPDATAEQGQLVGKRILKSVAKEIFSIESPMEAEEKIHLSLSVSIGVAEYPSDAKNRDDILALADQMMYKAKKSGRGQVCHANVLLSKDD